MHVARRSPLSLLLLTCVALVVGGLPLAPAAQAAPSDVVPNTHQVIGGCRVAFASDGSPYVSATRSRPCIGVSSVRVLGNGDLGAYLSWSADAPTIRAQVSSSPAQAARGLDAAVTRSGGWLQVRITDADGEGRLDLRDPSQRSRVAGTHVTLGWVGASPVPTGELDPGIDAYGAYRDKVATPSTTVPGGCVVRFATEGPWIHANSAHHCTGARAVWIDDRGRLAVATTSEQYGSIVNASADPDETLTARGITTGVEMTPSRVSVQFYDSILRRPLDLRSSSDLARVAGLYSNLWVSWTKTTNRPGAINASSEYAENAYGSYVNGSVPPDQVEQNGCRVKFVGDGAMPAVADDSRHRCTGVEGLRVDERGRLEVTASGEAVAPIISVTSDSNGGLARWGIRAGLSGGGHLSRYTFHSARHGRTLDLRTYHDRRIVQGLYGALYVGWTRPW